MSDNFCKHPDYFNKTSLTAETQTFDKDNWFSVNSVTGNQTPATYIDSIYVFTTWLCFSVGYLPAGSSISFQYFGGTVYKYSVKE